MKAIKILGLILLICATTNQVSLAQLGSEEAAAIERAQTRINNLVNQTDIRGATATYFWGDTYITITSGEKKSGVPVEEDGKFMLRSFTKLLVSTIILQLQEEGVLSIDDEIGEYLNPINNVDTSITIKELLSMRANVCDFMSSSWAFLSQSAPTAIHNPETILNNLIPDGNCNSRNRYEYNDTNFQLLGLIIESVTGNSGESEFENRLFSQLNDHSLSLAPIDLPEEELNGTRSIVNGNISDRGFDSKNSVLTTHKFNGGVVGTTKDALRLLVKILDGEIISEESLELMKDIDSDGYGLGLMNRVLEGDAVFGHGGSGLHISRTFYNPDSKLGVSIAANYSINQQDNAEQFLLNNYLELKTCRENGGCSFNAEPNPGELTEYVFEHENVSRTYSVYVPESYETNRKWPLILNFHGYSGDVPDHIDRIKMHDFADQYGYLIAYPVGLTITRDPNILPAFVPSSGAGWSVPGFSNERDEITFTEALLSDLENKYVIDVNRVHATGLSLGGYMAAYIGTQMPDKIASFASVAGHFTKEVHDLLSEDTQISAMLVHGTADIITDFNGLSNEYLSVENVANSIASNNNCDSNPTQTELDDLDTSDNTTVTLFEYLNCDSALTVEMYQVNGGGHRWPGSGRTEPAGLGFNSLDINTSEMIFEFFERNSPSLGTNIDASFFSEALQEDVQVDIHLPGEYYDSAENYPVVYFLHGATANQDGYQVIVDKVDSLINNSIIDPVILVKPDGSRSPYAGSFYSSSELYGDIEGYIVHDLQKYIEENYRTDTTRVCIMGHSMGGFGAMKLGLKYPDAYNCIVSHSGPLDVSQVGVLKDLVNQENGNSAPYNYNPAAGTFSGLLFSAAGGLSANTENATGVDFILNQDGEVDDAVLARWKANSPTGYLAASGGKNFDSPIYFDVGTNDELSVDHFNEFFDDSLDSYGLEYRYETHNGTHTTPSRYNIGLAFIDSVFKGLTTVNNEDDYEKLDETNTFALSQNYPNPFNPSTNISFEIPEASEVQLKVFNMLGQEVASLVDGRMNSGNHTVNFDASQLSSGVYIYRLIAGDQSITKKMMLIK